MDHATLVGRLEPVGDLARDADRFVDRQVPPSQSLREILAGYQLHRQEACALRAMNTKDGGDVGVAQRSEQLGFALEAGESLRIAGEGIGKDLDRHFAVEVGVRGFPDHTHPAFADLLDQAVVEQLLSGLDRHLGISSPGRLSTTRT